MDPLDRITWSTVGIAIGTAARASAMAVVKMAWVDWPREIPRANMIAMVRPAAAAIHSVNVSSCLVSGVFRLGADFNIPEMLPTAVSAPVPVTIITPLPCVTGEFMNAMFDWSPSTGFGSVITSALFEAGTLSPVSADSSICRELASTSRPSAHTSSPAVSSTTSPTDHLVGVDLDLGPVTADPGGRLEHRLQGVHRALRLALLAHPAQRVERRDQQDDDAGRDLADHHRGDGCRDQDDLHVAPVLGQELLPAWRRLLGGKRVRPVLLQQLGGLRRGEPLGRVDAELPGDLVRLSARTTPLPGLAARTLDPADVMVLSLIASSSSRVARVSR